MIETPQTHDEILECYEVMSQLRPHIKRQDFVPQVMRLMRDFGYTLMALRDEGDIKALAGFRIGEWLHGGRYLEIDDLVAKDGERSKGYGGRLFDIVVDQAMAAECDHVRLLSGVQRVDAHRFYLAKGMKIEAHYFTLNL